MQDFEVRPRPCMCFAQPVYKEEGLMTDEKSFRALHQGMRIPLSWLSNQPAEQETCVHNRFAELVNRVDELKRTHREALKKNFFSVSTRQRVLNDVVNDLNAAKCELADFVCSHRVEFGLPKEV